MFIFFFFLKETAPPETSPSSPTRRSPDLKGGKGKKKGQGGEKQNRRDRAKKPESVAVETPRLYVGNLSYDATEYDLEELFKGVGSVRKVELVYNRHTHKSKGYGFINMGNLEEAHRAVEILHDQPFMGRKMIVNGARSKGPANRDSANRPPRRESNKPQQEKSANNPSSTHTPMGDIPAEEEVHSLAPSKD